MRPVDLPPLPERPLVSALIASYNYGRYIGQCIESVLKQSYQNVEVVVCDDGSSDNSCEIIERYVRQDSRVSLIQQANRRNPASYTNAFQHSHGDILCILDSDDYWHLDKVEWTLRTFRDRPDTGYVIHPLMMVDANGCELQPVSLIDNFEEGWIADNLIRRGGRWRYTPASGNCFRRELAAYIYPLPDSLNSGDQMIAMLLPLLTKVAVVREYLGYYRLHGTNGTNNIRNFKSVDDSIRSTQLWIGVIERAVRAANLRITELKLDIPAIDIRSNLDHRLQSFALELLRGAPFGELVSGYAQLFPVFKSDDLYSGKIKAAFLAAYGSALFMPRGLRSRLIETLHMPNKLKYFFLRGRRPNRQAALAQR
jgi:glycosyltransferase involved in cell wall biosynthesis